MTTGSSRYRIEKNEQGRFVVVNARDATLAWPGQHWVDRDGGRPISFTDESAARDYAYAVFGGAR